VAIVAGAPATRMLAMVSPTSHHGQWSGASFKISGEERHAGIMCRVLGTSAFSPSMSRNTPLTASGDRAHTLTMSTCPLW
jgi:hypothetical protein